MNIFKHIIVGAAAMSALTIGAQANDLADLKAQIEALNGRIAQLETTPAVPAGYQLLSISEADAIIIPGAEFNSSFGTKATNIGILPTADVPASTNIQWSGYVKAAVAYKSTDFDSSLSSDIDAIDVRSIAGLKVVGTTDTAVGEVGVSIALISESLGSGFYNAGNNPVKTDGYWGYWKMTDELSLGGGVGGSISGNKSGFDGKASNHFSNDDGVGGYKTNGDPSQIRLNYKSGPIAFAIALEDGENSPGPGVVGGVLTSSKSSLGIAGEMLYSGDGIGFELNAGYVGTENDYVAGVGVQNDSKWTVNAGANLGLGDIAALSVAAGIGDDDFAPNSGNYTKASAFLGFTLSDSANAELGVSHKWVKGPADITSVGAGLYYTPVSQLTLGLEADWVDTKGSKETFSAALLSIYRF